MEKGSMLTAIEHGSVGPKRMAKAISESKAVLTKAKKRMSGEYKAKLLHVYIYIYLTMYNIL